jgi:acetyl esterase
MPLDPQAQKLLDLAKAAGLPPLHTQTIPAARARMAATFTTKGEREALHKVTDLRIPGPGGEIPIRIFRPSEGPVLPTLIFFHGGGWILNSIETHDALCRALANASGWAIVSVEYRLAPEYPFPAAFEDAWAATTWVAEHTQEHGFDANHIAVGGDSSGGALASAIAVASRDRQDPTLCCQVLIYPVTEHYTAGTPSYAENAEGYSLGRDTMVWFWDNYVPLGTSLEDVRLCPARTANLNNLPPTLIVTAEYDPLRDEAETFAARLRDAGVNVTAKRYDGMMHGFVIQFRNLDKGASGLAFVAEFLKAQHLTGVTS